MREMSSVESTTLKGKTQEAEDRSVMEDVDG